jgi:hypothetical protein
MRYLVHLVVVWVFGCGIIGCDSGVKGPPSVGAAESTDGRALKSNVEPGSELDAPVRLEADGEPIDIGKLSSIAHAGPWVADVDGDGDRDLLVGDFPGYFWLFDNIGSESQPRYTSKGKLKAGGVDAKTPVY